MSPRTATVALLFSLLSGMPSGAPAQVYKWVDDNGVVNYGDKPPARSKGAAQPLAENGGSVSVVPGIPREELERVRERDTQQRLRELEREVDELRARDVARDNAVPYTVPADVYVPAYAYGYGYGYGYTRRPPHRPIDGRPGHRPQHPIVISPPNRPKLNRSGPIEVMPGSPTMRGGRS